MGLKRINPKSLENLQPRFAPDKPGDTVVIGVRLRKDQREALDNLSKRRELAISVLIREALDLYLKAGAGSKNPTLPAAPGSPPLVDRSEVMALLDAALGMTKAKDIKPLLEKIRGLLTQPSTISKG